MYISHLPRYVFCTYEDICDIPICIPVVLMYLLQRYRIYLHHYVSSPPPPHFVVDVIQGPFSFSFFFFCIYHALQLVIYEQLKSKTFRPDLRNSDQYQLNNNETTHILESWNETIVSKSHCTSKLENKVPKDHGKIQNTFKVSLDHKKKYYFRNKRID